VKLPVGGLAPGVGARAPGAAPGPVPALAAPREVGSWGTVPGAAAGGAPIDAVGPVAPGGAGPVDIMAARAALMPPPACESR
jgi:hypothetical protein